MPPSNNMPKPSKKIIALSIVCTALVVSVVVSKILPPVSKDVPLLTTTDPNLTLKIDVKEDTSDSDGDTLKDWEEALWESDPHVKDSDGDGTIDGEEVQNGRNPSIAGPNDKIENNDKLTENISLYEHVVSNSLTDRLSRSLFGSFLEAKGGAAGILTSDQIESIATEAAKDINGNIANIRYSYDAIATFKDTDITQAKIYGQSLGRSYIDTLISIQNGPEDMAFMAKEYRNLASKLSLLLVPNSLRKTHTDLLNNFHNTANAFEIVASSENDPVRAMIAVKTYQKLATEQGILFTTIGTFLNRNGILFDDKEVQTLWENI